MSSEPRGSEKQYFPNNIWIPYYGKVAMQSLKEGMYVCASTGFGCGTTQQILFQSLNQSPNFSLVIVLWNVEDTYMYHTQYD